MQEVTQQPTIVSEAADPLVAAAYRAEAWAGEPFFREGEDAEQVLARGTARRIALDEALAEIEARLPAPSALNSAGFPPASMLKPACPVVAR